MLFRVQNLCVQRNSKMLLDNISFEIQQGEYLAIIGPNGAGKSTLLKCLDNIIPYWTGNITFDNLPLKKRPPSALAKRIAFVQQAIDSAFIFTVRQLVEMGRYPYLKPLSPISGEDRQIAEDAMRMMDILKFADRTIDTLSGGELQKVHLASALAQQADILFLDEPTTYLDYRYQSEIGKLLRSLNQETSTPKTIIEVTHDVNRAVLDATHVIALSEGKIVFDGSPSYLMQAEHLRTIYGLDFQFVNHPTLPLKLVVPGV